MSDNREYQRDNMPKGKGGGKEQKIIISNRELLEVQGVLKIEDFDKQKISLETVFGNLMIRGEELHIAHLLLEEEQLVVTGQIASLCFDEDCGGKTKHKKNGSFLQRLTK